MLCHIFINSRLTSVAVIGEAADQSREETSGDGNEGETVGSLGYASQREGPGCGTQRIADSTGGARGGDWTDLCDLQRGLPVSQVYVVEPR
jgi:hypothetical protein